MEPTNNWKTLVHEGPAMPVLTTCSNESVFQGALRIKKSKTVIRLDAIQTFLVTMFYERHHLKVDTVFQKNFWKSLKVPIRDSSMVDQFIKPRKVWSLVYNTPARDVQINGIKAGCVIGHVDGPSIFCGRDSQHPKRGTCKWGVHYGDVTLNMSRTSVPAARQRGFVHFVELPHVQWIASWKDVVTDERRYIHVKKADDTNKFDDARQLKSKLSKLHSLLNSSIQSTKSIKHQQLALAVYFIEHLCIRVGNEKDVEHEADTIGCCTLRAHTHIRVQREATRTVCVSFPGKDSVPFKRSCTLPPMFFTVARQMLQHKNKDDVFFDLVNPGTLNRFIQQVAPNCTAKSFRTMRASVTFERVLNATGNPVQANADVARLLNHRRMNNTKLNLETSRSNYIDPRIYHSFCNKTRHNPKPTWFVHDGGNRGGDTTFKF